MRVFSPHIVGKFRLVSAVAAIALTAPACSDDNNGDVTDTGSDTSGDTNSDTDSDVPSDTDSDTLSDTDGDIDLSPDGDADTGTGTDTGPDTDVIEDNQPSLVRIATPVHDSNVLGSIKVRLEAIDAEGETIEEREVDEVTLSINGETVYEDLKLPTEIVLDTRKYGSRLVMRADANIGFETGSHQVTLYANNPPITFLEATPGSADVTNGSVVAIQTRITGPAGMTLSADFSQLDSNFNAANVNSYPLGSDNYALTYIVSANNTRRDGRYLIPLKAKVGDWEVAYDQLYVELRNGKATPLFVDKGIFVDAELPTPTPGFNAPTVTGTNTVILTGGSSTITANWGNFPTRSDLVGIIVGVDGHSGYYQIPLTPGEVTNLSDLDILVRLRSYMEYETPPTSVPIRVALRDVRGNITAFAQRNLSVTRVGGGDIQVSLTWDSANDLDLFVKDPENCTTWYGNRGGCTGELDLDANVGCGSLSSENVFWPEGGAPEGVYEVRVNNFSACNVPVSNYIVTINYCGKAEVHEGRMLQSEGQTGSGANAGRIVTSFSNMNCSRTASGRIRYQDRTFDRNGFGALEWRTLEGVVVELRSLTNSSQVLGTGVTDRDGYYSIPIPAGPGFIVTVKARTDPNEGVRNIEVRNHPKFNTLYEVSSPPYILLPNQIEAQVDVDITEEQNAGAFNILDVMRRGYDTVRLATGRELGLLRTFWDTGTDTTDTFFCSQYLYEQGACTELKSVSVQGKATDRDEYDDMVILKEFFRFALEQAARDSHPGQFVNGLRDDARRAWTEGVAHFFASDVIGSRYFVNSRPNGVYIVDDLEGVSSPFAFNMQNNRHSYYMTAAALWDLSDSDNELHDPVNRKRAAIYDSLFSYLPSTHFTDRGVPGVDMTDFLDGWFCRGWNDMENVRALLVDYYGYQYDFMGPESCE